MSKGTQQDCAKLGKSHMCHREMSLKTNSLQWLPVWSSTYLQLRSSTDFTHTVLSLLFFSWTVSLSVGYDSEQQLQHNYKPGIVSRSIRAERYSCRCQHATLEIDLNVMCDTGSICHCKQICASRWIRQYNLLDSDSESGNGSYTEVRFRNNIIKQYSCA